MDVLIKQKTPIKDNLFVEIVQSIGFRYHWLSGKKNYRVRQCHVFFELNVKKEFFSITTSYVETHPIK
jgi:hypothetical protein